MIDIYYMEENIHIAQAVKKFLVQHFFDNHILYSSIF